MQEKRKSGKSEMKQRELKNYLKSIFNEDLNNTARSETRFVIEDGEDKQVLSRMTPTVDSRVLSLITHAADRQVITLLVAPTIDVIVDDICVVGGASCVRVDIASYLSRFVRTRVGRSISQEQHVPKVTPATPSILSQNIDKCWSKHLQQD